MSNGGAGISINGVQYEADKDGNVDIPEEFVELAASHGYVPAVEKKPAKGGAQ